MLTKGLYTQIFIAVLFAVAENWRQPKCPSRDELLSKLYIHPVECYSAIRRNIVLKAIQKVTYYTIQFLQHLQNDKIRDEKENGSCRGLGMVPSKEWGGKG